MLRIYNHIVSIWLYNQAMVSIHISLDIKPGLSALCLIYFLILLQQAYILANSVICTFLPLIWLCDCLFRSLRPWILWLVFLVSSLDALVKTAIKQTWSALYRIVISNSIWSHYHWFSLLVSLNFQCPSLEIVSCRSTLPGKG